MTIHSLSNDPRAKLDSLINYYESRHSREAGGRIPVSMTPAKLGKMLGCRPRPGRPDEFLYRGRVVFATVKA